MMDLRRLRPGEWMAGASGAALMVALFLPWYDEGEVACIQLAGVKCPSPATASAWEAFSVVDVLLVAAALLAMALLVLTATQRTPAIPIATSVLVVVSGIVSLLLVLFRSLVVPDVETGLPGADVERAAGLVLGLVGAVGIAAGGAIAMADERVVDVRRSRGTAGGLPVETVPPPLPGLSGGAGQGHAEPGR
jgi:hypothetical protein